jgi:transcriptional regulator GlxA family with amidase domain
VKSRRSTASDFLIPPLVWDRIEYFQEIRRAVLYFEENLADRLSGRTVAEVACLEQSAFSKAFKRKIGLTFRDFAECLRLSRAIEEMLKADQSLTEIALTVGFVSLTNFERAFRRRFGVTPSAYRDQLLQERGLKSPRLPKGEAERSRLSFAR